MINNTHTPISAENPRPQDIIIRQIRQQLLSGEMQPGMRLPAERKLAEQFGVGRTHVREALQNLESYGIVETRPQSGTYIVGLDVSALDGLIADVLRLDAYDFASLAEMRVILEVSAARFCAERRTTQQLERIRLALDTYLEACASGDDDKRHTSDFEFHRCIAAGSRNSTLRTMLQFITPDIMRIYRKQNVCSIVGLNPAEEHRQLYELIAAQRGEEAADLMKRHLSGMLEYALSLRDKE